MQDLIEELHGDQIYVEQQPEAYHPESPMAKDIYEACLTTRPAMKTDSRRTIQQGPKGNTYPSPKRGR